MLTMVLLGATCLVLGAGLAADGLRATGTEWLPLSTWNPDQEGLSNYEEVRVWGWPFHWVVDHPQQGTRDEMDLPAEASTGKFVFIWLFLSLGATHLLALGWLLSSKRETLAPGSSTAPATSSLLMAATVAPFSTFYVVHTMLPLIGLLIKPEGSQGLGHELRLVASMAVYATLAAYAVMLILGLPICLALRRGRRFTLKTVAWIGAVAGAAPFLYGTLTSIPAFFTSSEGSISGVEAGIFSLLLLIMSGGSGLASAWMLWQVTARIAWTESSAPL